MSENHVKNQRFAGINMNVGAIQIFWHPHNGTAGYYRAARGVAYEDSYRLMLHPEMSLAGLWEAQTAVEQALLGPGAPNRKKMLRRWLKDSKETAKTLPPEPAPPEPACLEDRYKALDKDTAEARRLAAQVDAKQFGGAGMNTKAAKAWRRHYL